MDDKYDKIFQIISEWDPVGLINAGAPYDEYSIEAKAIFRRIDSIENHEQLAKLIQNVFQEKMEIELDIKSCLRISSKMWKSIHKLD